MDYPPFEIPAGVTHGQIRQALRSSDPEPFINKLNVLGHHSHAAAFKKAWYFNGNLPADLDKFSALNTEQANAVNDYHYSYWLDWFAWYAFMQAGGSSTPRLFY
jgi:hypothetical protein